MHRTLNFAAACLATSLCLSATAQSHTTVMIEHFAFEPQHITVHAGETVTWTNHDAIEHTVTAQTGPGTLIPSGAFDSPLLNLTDSFSHRFTTTGTFHYFCIPHGSSMQGTVTVLPPACDSIDFNADGLFPDEADLIDFISVLAGGPCSNDPTCNDIDFNNDGLFPDDADLIAFLTVLAGGNCS